MNNITMTYFITISLAPESWDISGGSRAGTPIPKIDPLTEAARITAAAQAAGIHVIHTDALGDSPDLPAAVATVTHVDWSGVWENGGWSWSTQEWTNWFNSQEADANLL
jgi:hypothetical protein